jgi:hypothetical protein
MNAPPFPANPSFGQYFGNWVWSGSRWVCTNANGVRIVVQVFNASAPYTPSPGLISAVVECVGGGGSGGTVQGNATSLEGGGGGGSGGYSRIALASGLVLGGVNVTIGAGGSVPFPGSNPNDYAAGGAATSFGALCVANGGLGGGGNASTGGIWGYPGAGAPVGVGDLALPGNPGNPGTSQGGADPDFNVIGGQGGAIWGGGGLATLVGIPGLIAGNPGTGPGAGGGGAAQNQQAGAAQFGGLGANGLCIVTEYCWADTVDDGCGCGPTGQARVAIGGTQGHQWVDYDND